MTFRAGRGRFQHLCPHSQLHGRTWARGFLGPVFRLPGCLDPPFPALTEDVPVACALCDP